jgi:hypothetical protein
MSKNALQGLFPPEIKMYEGPKLKMAIIGSGLTRLSTAVELFDQGHKKKIESMVEDVDENMVEEDDEKIM